MKIFIVGIGPGNAENMTPRAARAIEESDAIVGYDLYIDLLGDMCRGKELFPGAMKEEVSRCRQALALAKSGKTVALLSSGDAGIYGMAGPMLEICAEEPQVQVEVVPGITAASSAAGILGAPLNHDFAVISLSDLLTPWSRIEKRILSASEADFVIVLYNPKSRKRIGHLGRAVALMLRHKRPDTPCGLVRNAGRDFESVEICPLSELPSMEADMLTTIVVGNSETSVINGKLVTPRGYTEI